jgi:hypothetical protein
MPEQLPLLGLAGRGAGLGGCYNLPVGWDQVAVALLGVILTGRRFPAAAVTYLAAPALRNAHGIRHHTL